MYYYRSHYNWGLFFPFSPILAAILFVSNKVALYAWNWADLLIILFCRGLWFQFGQLKRGEQGLEESKARTYLNSEYLPNILTK
jgi:hypothetical protein